MQFCASKGQNTVFVRYDSIPIYEIAHSDFENILDSFIVNRKNCGYSYDSVKFKINILDSYGVSIEISKSNYLKSFYVDGNVETYGILYHKDFMFRIEGRSKISNKVLKETDKKEMISLVKLNPDYINSSTGIWYIDDDCMEESWIFHYYNGKFNLTYNSEDYNK